jgi:2-polyprenyl-3-methyl-5-hydroxy-6-metoxy-1,4-benzoquinol methylase
MPDTAGLRGDEYALRGDYHRTPDENWEYAPTYAAKMRWVRAHLDRLPAGSRVLDVGCGEGVLVEEYASRLAMDGVDPNYSSAHVRRGSVLDLPFDPGAFDAVLCLDVLEHVPHEEQARALAEIRRVLKTGGQALFSLPNLAHLQSRVHFLVTGRFIRTASERKHPGDRPVREYLQMLRSSGFVVIERRGVFPTLPVVTHLVRRHSARLAWLHRLLTRLLPVPGWCFLNLVLATTDGRA